MNKPRPSDFEKSLAFSNTKSWQNLISRKQSLSQISSPLKLDFKNLRKESCIAHDSQEKTPLNLQTNAQIQPVATSHLLSTGKNR